MKKSKSTNNSTNKNVDKDTNKSTGKSMSKNMDRQGKSDKSSRRVPSTRKVTLVRSGKSSKNSKSRCAATQMSHAHPRLFFIGCILLVLYLMMYIWHVYKPLPRGINFASEIISVPTGAISFLSDTTYLTQSGERRSDQEIFAEIFAMIDQAQNEIILDMFLFNDFLGSQTTAYRQLSSDLTAALIAKKNSQPEINITVISDPINQVYGGDKSEVYERLIRADINVIVTDLTKLRDSNPLYSALWRTTLRWTGNSSVDGWLPHIMDVRRSDLTLSTYLSLLNFKANHRKVIITDKGILVTSANPHDGSSAHSNVALRINSGLLDSMKESELAVARMSGIKAHGEAKNDLPGSFLGNQWGAVTKVGTSQAQLVTEGHIKRSLIHRMDQAAAADRIDMAMFYISDRQVVKALKKADQRGVKIRLIFDPNKDAFGREKNGIPNRQVAHELMENSSGNTQIRWCNTSGEQCHSKITMIMSPDEIWMSLGSANLTRRNIGDYNLESNIITLSDPGAPFARDAQEFFSKQWGNEQYEFTLQYDAYADSSKVKYLMYRAMEATGLGSF